MNVRSNIRRQASRQTYALVRVGSITYRTYLAGRPHVGATIGIGLPVVVTESKDVAGGGILVTAEPLDNGATTAA
jgi:hypothetical protein